MARFTFVASEKASDKEFVATFTETVVVSSLDELIYEWKGFVEDIPFTVATTSTTCDEGTEEEQKWNDDLQPGW